MSATGTLSRRRHRADRPRPQDGRPAALRPRHPRRPPGHGQDGARHQHRLQRRQGLSRRDARRRNDRGDGQRRHRRLLLAGNVGRAIGDPHHRRAVGRSLQQDPPRRHHRSTTSSTSPTRCARCSRSPSIIDQTGGISIAQLTARARRLKRQRGLDLLVIDYHPAAVGLDARALRQPRAGVDRDHDRPQGAGQGAQRADPGAVAAFAPGRAARRQAAAALGPARIGLDRTGRRRRAVRLSRGILPQEQGAAARHARSISPG